MAETSTTGPKLSSSSRNKEARVRAMTEAAVTLFAEEGYSAVSTRRIAERAGCSETLLFRYFGDKRGLLLAVCNGLWDRQRPERSAVEDFPTVQQYLEHYLLGYLKDMKQVAPSIKVVIAALINDPEMTSAFGQKHDDAAERVAKNLRRFQETGAMDPDLDVNALANAVEQLGFALSFFLQLIFEWPDAELRSVAISVATALGRGLQANAGQPLLEPNRRKALAAVLGARERLDDIVDVLSSDELTNGKEPRSGPGTSGRSRA